MKPPYMEKCDGHWIVSDCHGNDVGFDTCKTEAELFFIGEMSTYAVWDFARRVEDVVATGFPVGNWFENKWR